MSSEAQQDDVATRKQGVVDAFHHPKQEASAL